MSQFLITEEELAMIKRHILLPYVIAVLEKDKKIMHEIGVKVPDVYAAALDGVLQEVYKEVSEIRKELRRQDIKVYETRRDPKMREWEYVIRGYRHSISMLGGFIRAEVERYLTEKMGIKS